ncbi:MAG: hypothetical protein N2039_01605 [Gemmataceae bacterium]|nr:hypothetical protein [Gemmataceae bacterium]
MACESPLNRTGTLRGRLMELLLPLVVLVVWFVLQAWLLPKLGVPT